MRDRGERISNDTHRDHRRRDDEDDRGRRDRSSGRGWGAAIRRSLSRNDRAGGHDASRTREDHGRERDCSGNRDGGRRRALPLLAPAVQLPLPLTAAPPQAQLLLTAPPVQLLLHEPVLGSVGPSVPAAQQAPLGSDDDEEVDENLATRLHKRKTPALLFKLDIRKAFDSIRWDYIVNLLQRRGFPSRFRNWIVALLVTASSRVLLNGVAGDPIKHGRGLRQGDPLSPLLFVLAIDPISQILEMATEHGLLHKIARRGAILRTSLYADDAAIFLAPFKEDVHNFAAILHSFGEATGLCTNFHKSSVVPIRCDGVDLDDILRGLPVLKASFPLKYLGLPLSVGALRKADFQLLEDKTAEKIPAWNGKFITMAGRTALVKSVLTSQSIYHLTSLNVPTGSMHNMKKVERAFLWAGTDKLRWPWQEWKEPSKIWVGLGNPCDDTDMDLFYASTTITLGNGEKTPFWKSPWLNGSRPIDIAPLIYNISTRKNWNVKKAMSNNGWISKIKMDVEFSIEHIRQYISLWSKLEEATVRDDLEDEITWNLTETGIYSSSSAYRAQFFGAILAPIASSVWKFWAPPKIKFFMWLALQNRLWTNDRLEKRGWPTGWNCKLCNRAFESVDHLLVNCRFTIRLWGLLKEWLGLQQLNILPWPSTPLHSWWSLMTKRKDLASLALLSWEIWNERNGRVFNNKHAPPSVILQKIKSEAKLWILAGDKCMGNLMPRE
ncbi:hypothetical protein ACQ4PT_060692 [Festuca glaucescens]